MAVVPLSLGPIDMVANEATSVNFAVEPIESRSSMKTSPLGLPHPPTRS